MATTFTVTPDEDGRRLDAFLAARLQPMSRARVQGLIRDGRVRSAAGVIAEASRRVKGGDVVAIEVPEAAPARPAPEDAPLDILFEDEHLVVLVKPAGLVVHPAPGHSAGTLVNALLAHCGASLSGIGGVKRPGIVHRLDRDVSGVLVVAKHDRAHLGLAGQFTVHSIERIYEAVVWGLPTPASGRIDGAIGRDPHNRLRMAVVRSGKPAVTDYRLLAAAGTRAARLELKLMTGRTHQIRVHLTSRGNPIIGDRLYGRHHAAALPAEARELVGGLDRIALHARHIAFDHPVTGVRLGFTAPAPDLFQRLLAVLQA